MTVLRRDLETVVPRSVPVAPMTALHHSVEILPVDLAPWSIPREEVILEAVVEDMAVVTFGTVTETEIVTETATFETTVMDRRFAEIWIATGCAGTATSTCEITGLGLAEAAQGPRRATLET